MASAYSTANGHWRARVVTDVTDETATTITIRVRAYWCSIAYGFAVGGYGTASCGSYNSSRTRFTASSDTGETREQLVCSVSHKYSKTSSKQNITCKAKIEITGGFENGTRTATVTHTIPAIDYDAPNAPSDCSASRSSDTQAKVTWDNGSTSTTKPRSSTKVERQTDSGSWSQIASVGSSTANYTDNGIAANHRYRYRVRAYGSGGYSGYATSGYIYTTPGKPSSVTATKTGAQSVQLAITGAAPYATSYAVERSTDGGTEWEPAGTPTSFPWVDSGAPAGTVVYRVAAVRGSLQSAWVQSNSVTTITPPLAPAVSGLPSVAATGSALTVSWVPNHPDGSEQTQAQVEYTVGDGSPQTATVEGAATSYQLPESVTESAATVKVRVRTHGLDEDWGAWSGYSTVTVAVPPQARFTTPAEDGAAVTVLPLVLAWEATDSTGIASQTLELVDADGGSLLSVQLAGDVRSFRIDDSVYALSNLSDYELVLTVLGGSSLATIAARQFSTDWAEPSMPEADLDVDPEDLSCAVTVHAGGFTPNLWVNPIGTNNGVTVTRNEDGSVTISGGTSTAAAAVNLLDISLIRPNTKYTFTVDKKTTDGCRFRVGVNYAGGEYVEADATTEGCTFTAPSEVNKTVFQLSVDAATTVSGTYRVMLNEGTEPAPWQPPGYAPPETVGLSVIRVLPDGSQWLVADGLTDGQECIDPLPPLNVDYTYLVTAYAETGASSALTVPAFVDSGGMEAFNFGQAAETAFTLGFNATGSESISHSGETYRFALGPDTAQLPTFYPDGDIDVSGSHSYVTYDHELYRRIRSIVRDRSNSVCWFRSAMGYRARCVASFGFSYDASRYRLIDVSASLTEVVWKDPSNG